MALTRVTSSVSDTRFDTVADLTASSLAAGAFASTQGYWSAGDGGHADYLIKTAAAYGGTPDEYGDHTLANGNVAVLQYSGAVNVKWFGAKGDGVTDDIASIQAALDYQKEVDFPYAIYATKNTLYTNNGQIITGNGSTLLGVRSSTTDAFNMVNSANYRDSTSENQKVVIKDLVIDAGGASLTDAGSTFLECATGMFLWYAEGTIISNVEIYNTGTSGITIRKTAEALIENCHIENIGYIPYPNLTDPNYQKKANGNGYDFTNDGTLHCKALTVRHCTSKNIRDFHYSSWASGNVLIDNCYGDGWLSAVTTINNRGGVSFESNISGYTDNNIVKNTKIEDLSSTFANRIGCFLETGYAKSIDNYYSSNSSNGMVIDGKYCETINDRFVSPVGATGYGIVLRGSGSGEAEYTKIINPKLYNHRYNIRCESAPNTYIENPYIECGTYSFPQAIQFTLTTGTTPINGSQEVNGGIIRNGSYIGIYSLYNNNVLIDGVTFSGIATCASTNATGFTVKNCHYKIDEGTSTANTYSLACSGSGAGKFLDNTFDTSAVTGNYYGLNLSNANVLVRHFDPTSAPTLNGNLSAVKGSTAYQSDATNGMSVWTNTDGATAWAKLV